MEQDAKGLVREEKRWAMNLNQKMWLCIGVIAGGIVLAFLAGGADRGRQALMLLSCLVIAMGLLLEVRLLRCPHCDTWIGKHPGEFCKNCGKALPWKEK